MWPYLKSIICNTVKHSYMLRAKSVSFPLFKNCIINLSVLMNNGYNIIKTHVAGLSL